MGLFNAEIRKLRTTWTPWILTFVAWAFLALNSGMYIWESSFTGEYRGTEDQVATLIDGAGGNSVFVLVVALLLVTTEFRHGTIGRTLQITPSRTRVLVAKGAASIAYSLFFLVTSVVIAFLFAGFASLSGDVGFELGSPAATSLWHGFIGLALTGLFGVALGALLRSQVVAITLSLVWIFVLEQMVNGFFPEIGRWLPFQALSSAFLSDDVMATMPESMQPLDPLVGLAVFIGYTLLAGAAAVSLMRTRDV